MAKSSKWYLFSTFLFLIFGLINMINIFAANIYISSNPIRGSILDFIISAVFFCLYLDQKRRK
ncbi:hypothetical protein KSB_95150 [Ktedonobacter robiniae]|uniref:Uncharacterized protein n=1 Tax=Ktedonobacter robiniae TaxID=2778365 RepID=A0ABQ3V8U1_9CHLR|nr:hypothetical protein KSB_95150 [Ktedonobacter robiniae]